jgi:CDP-diacylglycerol--serine O-phosphatidyltransferase
VALFVVTIVLSLLMVSNIKFRSFKDLRFNFGTAFLVLFAIASSAVVWQLTRPPFVLLWLITFYVAIGLIDAIRSLAARARGVDRPSKPDDVAGGNPDHVA